MQLISLSILLLGLVACDPDKPNTNGNHTNTTTVPSEPVKVPAFDGKSAYDFVQKQVDFGPRVPNTEPHKKCAAWLQEQFQGFGAEVIMQNAMIDGPKGDKINMTNIIASYNPAHTHRVLLCAHWDTRSVADEDTVRQDEPILGADDGGSGVGVLLEIARLISTNPIDMGIDIVLFDVEDQGIRQTKGLVAKRETWCLGSQYWANHLHKEGYKAKFGILLDMVGSTGARFPKEGISIKFAARYVDQVWNEALNLGYSDLFVQGKDNRQITDDHFFVNQIAKIPTLDIINLPENTNQAFGHYWHTHQDNMSVISPHTLHAVGSVLTNVIYKEAAKHDR
ncbi:MAG: M28 family peptidase [Aureispira sp.]|nr:M28 family peptidase [Aureispira sp.]